MVIVEQRLMRMPVKTEFLKNYKLQDNSFRSMKGFVND